MRVLLILSFFCISIGVHAQKSALIFLNQAERKAVQIPKGGMMVVQYRGYLKQMELKSNSLIQVNDSMIVMGKPRLFADAVDLTHIRISDITGFRKVSVGSQLLKTVLTVGATLGSYYALRNNGDKLSSTQQLLLSSGAGLLTNISLKFIFPQNRIKHKTKDGWVLLVR
ncbi:hypothetical protein SAMN06265379_103251 [Saccharicrinis carchari]|uniref:Uncharacterized protein n=1 Tax=Saccharicrinis carchari TaxID=1168039 RepID=A0A521CKX9_SACCC|nr:hypothetical protein [Saccharicrinis carchari]SMO60084.1 hypothetical protein SAMN06265379_103251 [Saccharicrinis carchari]